MRPGIRPGMRVRFNHLCPWKERRGCWGVVVESPRPDIYPAKGMGRDEVIVLLDRDPLDATSTFDDVASQRWTCVARKDSLD